MERSLVPGAWFGEQLPTGEWCALVPHVHVETHLGVHPLPPGEPAGPWYTRCTATAGFRLAGQAQSTIEPACWEWSQAHAGWDSYPQPCHGAGGPVIYDRAGALRRADLPAGANGYRYADRANNLITGDQTYGPFHGLFQYTALDTPDLWIGQAAYDGGGIQVLERIPAGQPGAPDQWVLRQLELGNCLFCRATQAGEVVGIAFQRPEGLVRMRATVAELRALPLVEAPQEPQEPLPAIGRPCWIACFEFDQHAGVGPGQALLAVRSWSGPSPRPFIETGETAAHLTGERLGHYLSGASVEEVEVQAALVGQHARPVAYWDANVWPRWPSLPPGSWTCVRAYQPLGQALGDFEASVRQQLQAAPKDALLALVCQQYTSNTSQAPDIRAQVPVYLRLARDFPQVQALLLFSGYGRAGGLSDHPEVLAVWRDQVVPATAAPAILPYPPPDPEPPDPPRPDPPSPYVPIKGASMEKQRGWFIGPGDQVLRLDAQGRVVFSGTDLTEEAKLERTPVEGDPKQRCEVRALAHPEFLLTADGTKYTPAGNVCLQYYGSLDPRGYYQMWAFGVWPFGVVTGAVLYDEQGADHGHAWMAAGLTWIPEEA